MRVRQPCSEAEAQAVRSCQHWDLFGPILGSILHLNLTDDAERVSFACTLRCMLSSVSRHALLGA